MKKQLIEQPPKKYFLTTVKTVIDVYTQSNGIWGHERAITFDSEQEAIDWAEEMEIKLQRWTAGKIEAQNLP
jgi:hypothetical protein